MISVFAVLLQRKKVIIQQLLNLRPVPDNFLFCFFLIKIEEVIVHYHTDTLQLLGINTVFVKKIIYISTVATEFTRQPCHTLTISLKSFFQNLSYMHISIYLISLYGREKQAEWPV